MPFIRYRCSTVYSISEWTPSIGQCTRLQCSAPCTLSSSSYYLAVLVTDPPDANFNLLKNPPIGQTTTLQFHHHAKADNSYPRLSPGQIEDLLNGKRTYSGIFKQQQKKTCWAIHMDIGLQSESKQKPWWNWNYILLDLIFENKVFDQCSPVRQFWSKPTMWHQACDRSALCANWAADRIGCIGARRK